MRTLYGYRSSPWTERALWALDHHGLSYRYHEHVPLLGEVLLRLKAGGLGQRKASVPLMVEGSAIFRSSEEIARHADRIGKTAKLFPRSAKGDAGDVARFVELSEIICNVGRAQVLGALRTSREARRESVPSFVPGPLRPAFAPSVGLASKFIGAKYEVTGDVAGAVERDLIPALENVRAALHHKTYLLGAFSFADIAIAAALRGIRPEARAPLGPALRAAWTMEPVAQRFEDLLMWRDALYEKHR